MAIFYTDTGSLIRLEVTGSTAMSGSSNVLHVKGSGSAILVVSGSTGGLMEISDVGDANQIFAISSGSIDVFSIDKIQNVIISGSLLVSASISSPTINLLSNEISQLQSVTDNVSALAPGAVAQVGLQNAINALSNRISAIPGGATSVNPTRFVSTANTLATAALTGISGLTVSVSAGVIYEIQGQIMYSVSAATGNAFGMIWPTANRVAGIWAGGTSVNEGQASSFSTINYGNFDTGDSNSAVWSAAIGIGLHFIKVEGIIDAQTTGALYPVARSSVATNTMVIARGSFFRVARIN